MTAVFLQARLGSTRLPRKALLPLGGDTCLGHAMRRLLLITADLHCLLTDKESYADLLPVAEKHGFQIRFGSKHDVLRRFAEAVMQYKPDFIIRATGDNPLVSPELAQLLVTDARFAEFDYAGYTGPPVGMGVERVASEALLRAQAEARSHYDREHVTPYLYKNRDQFRVAFHSCPDAFRLPKARVTLDTVEDYRHLEHIYAQLLRDGQVDSLELIRYLRTGHPT